MCSKQWPDPNPQTPKPQPILGLRLFLLVSGLALRVMLHGLEARVLDATRTVHWHKPGNLKFKGLSVCKARFMGCKFGASQKFGLSMSMGPTPTRPTALRF